MRVAIVGDSGAGYRPEATSEALTHSTQALDFTLEQRWFETEELATPAGLLALNQFDGIWVAPGSPYKSLDGVLRAIRLGRERSIPLLGTCAGFQHLILEYVRNVLGLAEAAHAEYDANAKEQAISRLACSLVGQRGLIRLNPGSMIARLYGRGSVEEQFHCNYAVNPVLVEVLRASNMRIAGTDDEGAVRVVELADHPFFVGTLFIPQFSSLPGAPHPLVNGFLVASRKAMDAPTSIQA